MRAPLTLPAKSARRFFANTPAVSPQDLLIFSRQDDAVEHQPYAGIARPVSRVTVRAMKAFFSYLNLNFLPMSQDFGLLLLRTALGLGMLFLHGWNKVQ